MAQAIYAFAKLGAPELVPVFEQTYKVENVNQRLALQMGMETGRERERERERQQSDQSDSGLRFAGTGIQ